MNSPKPQFKLSKLSETILSELDQRSRDVISRRFGISTSQVETLESIGKEYGITRERVRQIEYQAKKAIMGISATLTPANEVFENVFRRHGGILAQQHAVKLIQEQFSDEKITSAHIIFYLELFPQFVHTVRDAVFNSFWRLQDVNPEDAAQVVKAARAILKVVGHPLSQDDLLNRIWKERGTSAETLPAEHIVAQLIASKWVNSTPFGEWGLASWPETNPRGVGDKAYAVLRRHGAPEHFTKITSLINQAEFDHKKANPQTVHNELIKDNRFVLVGRGLYGLAEWGYIPGTVGDVLESLLNRAKRPLTREELIEQVLAQRQVKKNTILLGLQNEDRFVKTPENRYTLKEKS